MRQDLQPNTVFFSGLKMHFLCNCGLLFYHTIYWKSCPQFQMYTMGVLEVTAVVAKSKWHNRLNNQVLGSITGTGFFFVGSSSMDDFLYSFSIQKKSCCWYIYLPLNCCCQVCFLLLSITPLFREKARYVQKHNFCSFTRRTLCFNKKDTSKVFCSAQVDYSIII